MKQQLLLAFEKTLIPDKDSIQKGTQQLALLRKNEGCCLALLQIGDDVNIKPELRQAALAQLKLSVERRWSEDILWKTETLVSEEQRAEVRKYLLQAVIRCNLDTRYLKLYKAIVKNIVASDFEQWLPVDEIIAAMAANAGNISAALHFAFAIAHSFEMQMDEVKEAMDHFIKKLFPALFELIKVRNTPENIFLVNKILWKGFHMGLGLSAQEESLRWIPFLLEVLNSQNADLAVKWKGASQTKNTPEFYYFQSKKWAARTLFRFIQRHANSVAYKEVKEYEQIFFSKFGHAVVETLLTNIPIPTLPKCKYFLLRSLSILSQTKPLAMDPHAPELLYNQLPPFLTLTPSDDKLAREDPAEFLRQDFDHVNTFTNTKKAATELWINLNKIGSVKNKNETTPGKHIFNSMEWLKKKLEGTNLLEKEMAMYLVCRLWSIVTKIDLLKNAVPVLLSNYVLNEFANSEMLVRARALEMFKEYGNIKFPDPMVLQKAVEGIYRCITNDPSSVVSVKAAAAFNTILTHKQALKMVKPYLSEILTAYVKMLDIYDNEDVVQSLQGLVNHYTDAIAPFAVQLVRHLCAVFLKYCKIDKQKCQEDNYEGDVEFAASGCLNTISKIISSPIPKESLPALEEFILPVISYCMTMEGNDHFMDSMDILGGYLHSTPAISPQMWFFYPAIIYYVISIPENTNINILPAFNPLQEAIFDNLHSKRLEEVDLILPPLRVYISRGHNLLMAGEKDFFGVRLLALIFQLTDFIYRSEPDNEFEEIDQQRSTASALLVTLLENVPANEELAMLIWQVVKANTIEEDAKKYLVAINIQLLCMCLFRQPLLILKAMNTENVIAKVFTQMMTAQSRFEHSHQKKRYVLGLSSILRNARAATLHDLLPPLFRMIMKQLQEINLIREEQLKESEEGNSENSNTDDESSNEFDDEGFWDENYDTYYIDALENIDEAVFFEESLKALQVQDPEKYRELAAALTAEEIRNVEENVQQAKLYFVKLHQRKSLELK